MINKDSQNVAGDTREKNEKELAEWKSPKKNPQPPGQPPVLSHIQGCIFSLCRKDSLQQYLGIKF